MTIDSDYIALSDIDNPLRTPLKLWLLNLVADKVGNAVVCYIAPTVNQCKKLIVVAIVVVVVINASNDIYCKGVLCRIVIAVVNGLDTSPLAKKALEQWRLNALNLRDSSCSLRCRGLHAVSTLPP